jgi:hypothetical protein
MIKAISRICFLFTATLFSINGFAAESGYVELDPKKYDGNFIISKQYSSDELYFCNTSGGSEECSIIFYYDPTCEKIECDETQNIVRDWVKGNYKEEYLGGTIESGRYMSSIYVRLPFFYDYKNHYEKAMTDKLLSAGFDNASYDFLGKLHSTFRNICGLGQYNSSENAHCAEVMVETMKDISAGTYTQKSDTYREKRAEKILGPFDAGWQNDIVSIIYNELSGFYVFGNVSQAQGRPPIQWWDALGSKSGGYPIIVVNTDEVLDSQSRSKKTKKKFFNTKGKSASEITYWLDANAPVVE